MSESVTQPLGQIPFNRAAPAGNEMNYVLQAIEQGHIAGNGPFTHRAEELLIQISGSPQVLLTSSCTHALELAGRLLNLKPGDEVIVPAFTFVSTAAAFALAGARPIFVDVKEDTLNLDIEALKSAITKRTRAVCAVHYAGVADGVDKLALLCREAGVDLIEDNAHGLGGTYSGQSLGTFGNMATMSFHETKNVTCGEGGALALNSSERVERAEILREKGTNRTQFLRGQTDKYTWVDVGSSWITSDMQAAFLVGQLENFESIQDKRLRIWNTYHAELAAWSASHGVRRPHVPSEAQHPAHMYYLQFSNLQLRTDFIDHMAKLGIMAVFHYQSLNTSPVGLSLGGVRGQCPVSERASDTLVRLPLYAGLTSDEIERVVSGVLSFNP